MKLSAVLIMAIIPSLSLPATAGYGDVFDGWGFVQDDWQVVCDNTRTCRAAGYSSESSINEPASVLFTAIPKVGLPKAQIQVVSASSQNSLVRPELWLNHKNYGALRPTDESSLYDLSAKQTQALIHHARVVTKIQIRAGDHQWRISDKGMAAVLLKLDEVQGRVGTSMALISQDNPNRKRPKAALPKPIIKQAFAYSEKDNKTLSPAMSSYFQQNINKWVDIDSEQLMGSGNMMGDCELVNPKTSEYQRMAEYGSTMLGWDFIPVDKAHTLATHLCWSGPYNASTGYWLIKNQEPSSPLLITTAGNEYETGAIRAANKDRGIGDCWNYATWTWDGQTFVKSKEASTGLCRGFAGGAWDLPSYVSKVINNNDKAQ